MTVASESVVHCLRCGGLSARVEVVEHPKGRQGPQVEMYQCEDTTCGAKAALMFEPVGGTDAEAASWVEKEVARRGSFFPSDFSGQRRGRWG